MTLNYKFYLEDISFSNLTYPWFWKKYILSQVNLVRSHPKTIKIYLVLVTGRILGGENITYFSYVAIFEKVHDKVRWILFFSQITLLMYIWTIYIEQEPRGFSSIGRLPIFISVISSSINIWTKIWTSAGSHLVGVAWGANFPPYST